MSRYYGVVDNLIHSVVCFTVLGLKDFDFVISQHSWPEGI
jgi:hypothetical protein